MGPYGITRSMSQWSYTFGLGSCMVINAPQYEHDVKAELDKGPFYIHASSITYCGGSRVYLIETYYASLR